MDADAEVGHLSLSHTHPLSLSRARSFDPSRSLLLQSSLGEDEEDEV